MKRPCFFSLSGAVVTSRLMVLVVMLFGVSVQSCVSVSPSEKMDTPASTNVAIGKLTGTRWRLVEIQSMNDAIGTTRPSDRDMYTLDLNSDGTAAMRLNCNRAVGPWSATPVASGNEGGFRIGPLAMTRALCPPPSLDERIAKDMTFVRSFILKDGRLNLSLFADGGIYVWEPR